MEGLFRDMESRNHFCKYYVLRYGNVMYSTGSVMCIWKRLIEQGKEVMVTDRDATRFYWTRDQAIDLIFECLEKAKSAVPYCPKMKSIRMGDLLHAMIQKYSNGKKIKIVTTKLQDSENKHETLDGLVYSNEVERYTIDEIIEMI